MYGEDGEYDDGAGTGQELVPRHQQLFLVEFLVDTVSLDPCAIDPDVLEAPTCLTLKFLKFPPMDITEKDFASDKSLGADRIKFNSGKSLMFALNKQQCDNPPALCLELLVSKAVAPSCHAPSEKVPVGTIKVCIAELFRHVVEVARWHPDRLPASKAVKDCYMLVGAGKRSMGEIGVYIRLTCLGPNVVTEFQCGESIQGDPVLFKNREGQKIFQMKRNESEDACGQGDGVQPVGSHAFSQGNRLIVNMPGQEKPKEKDCKQIMEELTEKAAEPERNTFVLKVGDKGPTRDRGKMIIELKTPKQKMLSVVLPPYHEEVGTQFPEKKGKGKKGKGKKGKGKKAK